MIYLQETYSTASSPGRHELTPVNGKYCLWSSGLLETVGGVSCCLIVFQLILDAVSLCYVLQVSGLIEH